MNRLNVILSIVVGMLTYLPALAAPSPEVLSKAPAWQLPDAQKVRSQVMEILAQRKVDEPIRAQADELWGGAKEPSGLELLDLVVQSFALADEDCQRLLDLCSKPRTTLVPPSQPWLTDSATPAMIANNFRLYYGRWLAQERMFDEAKEQLAGLEPKDVVDPASLLFYQGVVCHRLLDRENGMKAIDRLLEGAEQSPRRYTAVARLMKADLKDLEEDTLNHISRRMEDIQRRLDLGRAGPKVRKVEDGVIESLDKMIKKLQDQQQQQQQQASSGGSMQPSNPAQESQIMEGKGRGEVTKRDIGDKSGWGDLPPKDRQEALQQIGRDFPAHYRDVIEQYFRRLAGEGSE